MLIPAGSVIVPNVWFVRAARTRFSAHVSLIAARKFLHDPERYTNPMVFEPARFLSENGHEPEEDPEQFCFGFGRR